MPICSFDYCSLQYLFLWLEKESNWHETLAKDSGATDDTWEAIQKAAGHFRVARNLPAMGRSAKDRYTMVLDEIDKLPRDHFGSNMVDRILNVESKISRRFGGRKVLSFATKMLWLKFRSPIIIYDSRARRALKLKDESRDSLGEYCSRWQKEFSKHKKQISTACARLPSMSAYTMNPDEATPEQIQRLTQNRWFHERVFDTWLWKTGGPS